MIPSIGRIVWVNLPAKSDQLCPALVTYIHDNNCVNLAAHDRNGDLMPLSLIGFYHGDDGQIPVGWCGWMPYQVQAQVKPKIDLEVQANHISRLDSRVAALEAALKLLPLGNVTGTTQHEVNTVPVTPSFGGGTPASTSTTTKP